MSAAGGDLVQTIADRLVWQAVWHDERCAWYGYRVLGYRDESFGHCGADLYGGTAGIGLFLAAAARHRDDDLFARCAQGALAHAAHHADALRAQNRYGAFDGVAGIAFALIVSGGLLDDRSLAAAGSSLLGTVLTEGPATSTFDVISGWAGIGLATCALVRAVPAAEELVARAAQALQDSARRREDGTISWSDEGSDHLDDLTGFAHGASGCSAALATAYAILRSESLLEMALDAARYERRWFDAEQVNWRDLRLFPGRSPAPAFSLAWCHGAPGIGLARRMLLSQIADRGLAGDLAVATRTAARHSAAADWSTFDVTLCHGGAGVLACIEGSEPEPDACDIGVARDRLNDALLELSSRGAWPCGVPSRREAPGLLTGIAGLGYEALRRDTDLPHPFAFLPAPARVGSSAFS